MLFANKTEIMQNEKYLEVNFKLIIQCLKRPPSYEIVLTMSHQLFLNQYLCHGVIYSNLCILGQHVSQKVVKHFNIIT